VWVLFCELKKRKRFFKGAHRRGRRGSTLIKSICFADAAWIAATINISLASFFASNKNISFHFFFFLKKKKKNCDLYFK
jgi:hypothetical protein